ncbi:MAG: 2-amino-4-hydroxy-6-hydroxymethyldihydropteridine diphosphokinase [Gammaproteobacteria bacterium]|jgi:2-amino-4-hydroxy-6-hydroxymethyldihydropteridine diphosphokinase|nr:2-amino-4-hydroxy-6-hydroxymethyldihydropteridine diphosphokinase [Gammaproteobacteria bacterium]|tara:strand:+ start:376 stop:876 length:501 start_codon:yes stop_codon:yes gene_type:complete
MSTSSRHQVFLSIGSNIDAEANIRSVLIRLRDIDREMTSSRVYRSEAMGFNGPPFLNLVTGIRTGKSLQDLSSHLKAIEREHGRAEGLQKNSSRTLDIDILLYDDLAGQHSGIELPRPEIRLNAYVLRPFAELKPLLKLPGTGDTLEAMWQSFDQSSQPLIEVSVE